MLLVLVLCYYMYNSNMIRSEYSIVMIIYWPSFISIVVTSINNGWSIYIIIISYVILLII